MAINRLTMFLSSAPRCGMGANSLDIVTPSRREGGNRQASTAYVRRDDGRSHITRERRTAMTHSMLLCVVASPIVQPGPRGGVQARRGSIASGHPAPTSL